MAEKKVIAIALVCLALSIGLIGTVMALTKKENELQTTKNQISGLENEKSTLETQISTTQSEKTSLETQVSSLQSKTTLLNNVKTSLETQVSSLQTEVTVLGNEKSTLSTQVSLLEGNVSFLQSEVASLETDTVSLETQVLTLQAEVTSFESEVIQSFSSGYVEGESEGYQRGYDDGYIQAIEDATETGWYLRDPTYNEALAFINSDKTDQNSYSPNYVCYDYTSDFNSNAFQAGYRCGFVYIEFSNSAHAITCFNTTDMGLIYIEPQTDEIVTISIGQTYLGYAVTRLGIIW